MTPEALVRSETSWQAVPFVPEIRLLTAAEPFGLWDRSGRDAPPFWAFPWGGGQGLARYVLDNPATVRGRSVLDVASGSGLVAIAAAKAGAASVLAGDVDVNAVTAVRVNAEANEAAVTARILDLAEEATAEAQVVLAADVFYQRELAQLALSFLREMHRSGADVLVADPGRPFLPAAALTALVSYEIPVLSVIEETSVKTVTVYRLALSAAPIHGYRSATSGGSTIPGTRHSRGIGISRLWCLRSPTAASQASSAQDPRLFWCWTNLDDKSKASSVTGKRGGLRAKEARANACDV